MDDPSMARVAVAGAGRVIRDESLRTMVLFAAAVVLTVAGLGHYMFVAGEGDPTRGHVLSLVTAGAITFFIAADGARGE